MMCNVMLAFLGVQNYLPCNYSLNGNKKISNVRFIQEAIARLFCKGWTEEDRIFIFLTKDAKDRNWVNNGHRDSDDKPLLQEGLEHRLKRLELRANIVPKDVPTGESEDEIWAIFDEVFNQISDGDEVIFDITHGFRSLPMLAIIILNYARVLKNIKIKGVYYGAFESLGSLSDVKKMDVKERDAPIFNLTPFIHIFNWTGAVNDFLTFGDAKGIRMLTNEETTPILRETRGKDESAQNLKKLTSKLEGFSELIQTSRGLSVIRDFDFNNLRDLIKNNKESILKPINPLLDSIYSKIKNFSNNDIENGYAAVEWCIEHNLTQQGYTILQETMISEIVAKHLGDDAITNRDKRALVSHAINIENRCIREEDWKELAKKNKADIKRIMSDLDDDFVKLYDSVSQDRNDINHAAFGDNPSKPKDLKRRLEEYYGKLKGGKKDV